MSTINSVNNNLASGTGLPVTGISASGTPNSATYLRGDGSWQTIAAGEIINVQTFSSSGTYTPTAGIVCAMIECWGGGGGGGGISGSAGQGGGGGGGQAGGYSRTSVSAATIGANQTVTIGSAGLGQNGFVAGTAGTNTSVGSLCVAIGGSGGGGSDGAGAGGGCQTSTSGAAGNIIALGAPGNNAVGGLTEVYGNGGQGGSSLVGAGGAGQESIDAGGYNGNSATGFAAGGAGAAASQITSSYQGGNGTGGYVVITEYFAYPTNSDIGVATGTSLQLASSGGLIGVTDGSSAGSGYVGEILTSGVVTGNFTVTTTNYNLATLSLTSGDWDIYGTMYVSTTSANTSNSTGGLTLTSLSPSGAGSQGFIVASVVGGVGLGSFQSSCYLPVQISTTTTIYLAGQATWSGGSAPSWGATITARRIR